MLFWVSVGGGARVPGAVSDRLHVLAIVCRQSERGRSGRAYAVTSVASVSDGKGD